MCNNDRHKIRKGQNIIKYRQKKLNLKSKTDKKTRNYIFSSPHHKLKELELILTSDYKTKRKTTESPFNYNGKHLKKYAGKIKMKTHARM